MTVLPSFQGAHDRAVERLIDTSGSVRAAFDGLGCGVTFDDLTAYVDRDLIVTAIQEVAGDLDRLHGRLVGLVASAALTIVEADRAGRSNPVSSGR